MVYLKKLWNIIIYPYTYIRDEMRYRKRLKELKKRDPFIYK
jgi:hypothetical protein